MLLPMGINNMHKISVKRSHLDQGVTLAKKYKALILDIDGTIIPKRRDAVPSKKVIEAISQVRQAIHVGIATSRPLFVLTQILNHIRFSGPSIINGGAQIVDFPSKKLLWEKALEKEDAEKICRELKQFTGQLFYLNNGADDIIYDNKHIPDRLLQIYIAGFTQQEADLAVSRLSSLSSQAAIHKVPSWQEDKTDVIVTHTLATKQHGIFEVAKILAISTHEIIGVGDGYNDFPLLMACGLKVAMGNGVDDLKAIADYIAPTVEEDGVADVINKFVLH